MDPSQENCPACNGYGEKHSCENFPLPEWAPDYLYKFDQHLLHRQDYAAPPIAPGQKFQPPVRVASAQCADCGHSWTGPGYDQDINTTTCPNCGSYRLQPSPVNSEMEMRDMPAPGEQDMGGNPLQEGVWGNIDGGWQNRMKRDESFASVKTAGQIVQPGPGGFHGDPRFAILEMNEDLERAGRPGLTLNGIPAAHAASFGMETHPNAIPYGHKEPIEVDHPTTPRAIQMAAQVIQDGAARSWNEIQRQRQERAQQRQQPQQPQAKVAFDDDMWGDDEDFDFSGDPNPYDANGVAERFIVTPEGRVLRPSQALQQSKPSGHVFHEDVANEHGLGDQFTQGHSLGQVHNNGNISFLQHETPHDTASMQQLLAAHFPNAQLSGELTPTTNSERWNLPMTPRDPGGYEHSDRYFQQGDPKTSPGPAVPHWQRPASTRGRLYLPWNLDTERIATDFEVEEVIPPEDDLPSLQQEQAKKSNTSSADRKLSFLPLLLGLAGGALAEGAGAGAAGALAGRLGGSLVGHLVGNALGGSQQGGNAAVEPLNQPGAGQQSWDALSSVHDRLREGVYEHPSSNPGFDDTDDPESVDQHEVNDQSHDHWQKDQDVNDMGGTDHPDVPLDGELGQAFIAALPSLLKYYDSDESGSHDPAISHLAELLERDMPGMIGAEPSDEDIHHIQQAKGHSEPSAVSAHAILSNDPFVQPTPAPGTQQLQNPVQDPQQQVAPQSQTACAYCGARLSPGQGVCPQCQAAITPAPNTATNPQAPVGPQPQQPQQPMGPGMSPVMANTQRLRLLNTQEPTHRGDIGKEGSILGRDKDGVHVQWDDGNEVVLHQLTDLWQLIDPHQSHTAANQGPHNPEQFQAVAEYLKQQGREELIPDLIDHPENYGEILAQIQGKDQPPNPDPDVGPPPMDPNAMAQQGQMPPGGGGMPPQGMPQMMGAVDSVAPKCPKCNSHSTELAISDIDPGNLNCHTCGHHWKRDDVVPTKYSDANPIAVPSADQVRPDDPTKDVNPGNLWKTQDGQPLHVGQEYEMYSAKYDVPDIVRIEAVKPNSVEYTLTGEYGLEHRTEISREEAEMDGLTFLPAEGSSDVGDTEPQQDQQAVYNEMGPPDQMDLSNGGHEHKLQASWTARLAGKKFTPMEQREFIDEPGQARNGDKLALENTHYMDDDQAGLSADLFLFGL